MIKGWKNNPQWRMYYHNINQHKAAMRAQRLQARQGRARIRKLTALETLFGCGRGLRQRRRTDVGSGRFERMGAAPRSLHVTGLQRCTEFREQAG